MENKRGSYYSILGFYRTMKIQWKLLYHIRSYRVIQGLGSRVGKASDVGFGHKMLGQKP